MFSSIRFFKTDKTIETYKNVGVGTSSGHVCAHPPLSHAFTIATLAKPVPELRQRIPLFLCHGLPFFLPLLAVGLQLLCKAKSAVVIDALK